MKNENEILQKEEPTKEQIQKWCNALRSGKYKQGKDCLQRAQNTYCCLGVACKIFIPKEQQVFNQNEIDKIGHLYGSMPDQQKQAPEWLEVISDTFQCRTGESLPHLNDVKELTFDEIADCLELVYIHKILD